MTHQCDRSGKVSNLPVFFLILGVNCATYSATLVAHCCALEFFQDTDVLTLLNGFSVFVFVGTLLGVALHRKSFVRLDWDSEGLSLRRYFASGGEGNQFLAWEEIDGFEMTIHGESRASDLGSAVRVLEGFVSEGKEGVVVEWQGRTGNIRLGPTMFSARTFLRLLNAILVSSPPNLKADV